MDGFNDSIKRVFFGLHFSGPARIPATEITIVELVSPPYKRILKIASVILSVLLLATLIGFITDSRGKLLPGTEVEKIALSSLTPSEAALKLAESKLTPPAHTIELVAQEITIASSSAELKASYQYDEALAKILTTQQTEPISWLQQLLFNNQQTQSYPLPIFYDHEQLRLMIAELKQQTDAQPHQPSAKLTLSGASHSLVIDPGQNAFSLNAEQTFDKLIDQLQNATSSSVPKNDQKITVEAIADVLSRQLTEEQTAQAKLRAEKIVGEKLVFKKDYTQKILGDQALVSLLAFPEGYRTDVLDEILQNWAQNLNRSPQNADFVYDQQTMIVSTFVPHRNGLTLDLEAMKKLALEGLTELEGTDTQNLIEATITKDLVLQEALPEKSLADTNDLGIKERIGFGESHYDHSIPGRIHNVALTTQRINLTLVAPGEEFSFNKTLGDVSAATGFQPAYVIKDGQTVLGDGGGVCQVSSTVFRALLDSGLNITRRLQHSYRVSYYELNSQPGFDATVYSGNVDLRFINDTENYVLIYGQTDSNNLYMFIEIYGTSDGRTTEITNYQSWDPRPPLPTVYIPDPTLAPGQLRQIDWSAAGIKAKFTHIVRDKDGNVMRENEYYSNYRPWAAKYLQGA